MKVTMPLTPKEVQKHEHGNAQVGETDCEHLEQLIKGDLVSSTHILAISIYANSPHWTKYRPCAFGYSI